MGGETRDVVLYTAGGYGVSRRICDCLDKAFLAEVDVLKGFRG